MGTLPLVTRMWLICLVCFSLSGKMQQTSAFYVMTNLHVTPFQKNGTCAEVGATGLFQICFFVKIPFEFHN